MKKGLKLTVAVLMVVSVIMSLMVTVSAVAVPESYLDASKYVISDGTVSNASQPIFKDGKVNYYLNKENLYFKDGLVYAYENGELYVTEYTDNLIATEGKEYLEFSEYYMVERVNKYLDDISGAFPSLREANDFVQGTRKSAYSQEGNCIVTGYVRSEEGAGTEYWTDIKEAGEDFCFVCKQNPNTFYKYSQSLGYAEANISTHSLISAGDCYIYKNSAEEGDVYVTSYEEGFNSLLEQNFDTESGAFIINGEIFTWNSDDSKICTVKPAADGKSCLVTAVNGGTATIVLTNTDNNRKAYCKVKVLSSSSDTP